MISFRLRYDGTQLSFFVFKILDLVERLSLASQRSVCSLKRRSVSESHMTSGFLGSLQGAGSEVGEGGQRERGNG